MSEPQHSTYSITVFVVEGRKAAIIITAEGKRLSQRTRAFRSPAAALSWCRHHHAGMVYAPATPPPNPAHN